MRCCGERSGSSAERELIILIERCAGHLLGRVYVAGPRVGGGSNDEGRPACRRVLRYRPAGRRRPPRMPPRAGRGGGAGRQLNCRVGVSHQTDAHRYNSENMIHIHDCDLTPNNDKHAMRIASATSVACSAACVDTRRRRATRDCMHPSLSPLRSCGPYAPPSARHMARRCGCCCGPLLLRSQRRSLAHDEFVDEAGEAVVAVLGDGSTRIVAEP